MNFVFVDGVSDDFTQVLIKLLWLFKLLFFSSRYRLIIITKALLKSQIQSVKELANTLLLLITLDLLFVHGGEPRLTSTSVRFQYALIDGFGTDWEFNTFIYLRFLLLNNSFSHFISTTVIVIISWLIEIIILILIKHHLMLIFFYLLLPLWHG